MASAISGLSPAIIWEVKKGRGCRSSQPVTAGFA
jgi:hypothetical protein